jgi:hypothetical protein
MNVGQKTQTSASDVRPVSGPAGLENAVGAVREIVDIFRTLYPESQYELDYAEDAVIVTIITRGFDFVMNAELQRIAKTYNVSVGFNVEPFNHEFINLYLIVSEVGNK